MKMHDDPVTIQAVRLMTNNLHDAVGKTLAFVHRNGLTPRATAAEYTSVAVVCFLNENPGVKTLVRYLLDVKPGTKP